MSKVATFGLVATSVTAGVVLVSPTLAGADSPNPTSGTGTAEVVPHPRQDLFPGVQVIKVTLTGTWDWERGNWCFNDRWASGWEIDWNDANQPGHVVATLNGVTYDVGVAAAVNGGPNYNAFDNTVDFYNDANRCGTRPAGSDRDIGNWGPIVHYYPVSTTVITPCAVMYDIHEDRNAAKVDDLIAGGAGHNNDNSIEKNSADVNICFPITINFPPKLSLVKKIDSSLGGTAQPSDFTLTATPNAGGTTITGPGNSPSVTNQPAKAGTYTLSESSVANYTPAATWVCTGSAVVSMPAPNQVTLKDASPAPSATCEITNKFNGNTDLKLTKSVDNPTPIAGGAAFNYTIAVSNIGNKPLAGTATIVDVLPAGLEYVNTGATTPAAGVSCTAPVGPRLTCTATAAAVNAGLSFTVPVRAPSGTISGPKTNVAFVHVAEDPACQDPAVCVPPCPPQSNNVGCSTVDIDRQATLTVTKTDSVPDGTNIKPGDTYSYTMKVRNNGPSTVSNVVLTDDFPTGLTVLSVTPGAGWTGCAATDPLGTCTFAGPLAKDAETTVVTVSVRLSNTYTQSSITNTAKAIGLVDDKGTPGTADDEFTPEATDDETTPVLTNVDLVLDKSDGGALVVAGQNNAFTYTLTIDNAGTRDLTAASATVVDTMPAWFDVQPFAPAGGISCIIAGSAENGGQETVTCTVPAGLLDANDAPVTISIPVKVLAGAPSGNPINRAYVDVTDDPVCPNGAPIPCPPPCPLNQPNNNVDCEPTTVDRDATLTVVKEDNVANGVSIKPGDTFSYTLKVRNNGPSTVTNVVLTDDFPTGLTVLSVTPGAGWTGCAATDPLGTCTFAGPLAKDAETSVVTVTVRLSTTYALSTITNTGKARGLVDDKGNADPADDKFTPEATDDETTPVQSTVDLILTKSDGGAVVVAGQSNSFVYTLTVDNIGTRDVANNATVTDTLPAWFEFQTGSFVAPANVSCNVAGTAANGGQQTVTCTVAAGILEVADAPVQIQLPVKVLAGAPSGTYTNKGIVDVQEDPVCPGGAPQPCPPPCPIGGGNPVGNNNVGCDDTPVSRQATLSVDKVDNVPDGTNIKPGDSFTYALKVKNLGPSTVTNVVLSDDFPVGLTVTGVVAGAGWIGCAAGDPLGTCTFAGPLAPNAETTVVTVSVTLAANYAQNTVVNEASAIALVDNKGNADPGDDQFTPVAKDTETTPVLTPVDLVLDKSDGGALAVAGQNNVYDYFINVKNVGTRNIAGADPVVVTDILPVGFVFDSATGATCTASALIPGNSQIVTCDVPPAALTAGGAGITITVKVKISQDTPAGNYTNKAFVTTREDPVCVIIPCIPPCPPVVPANNNVDCEPTTVVRDATLTVTKVDNVPGNAIPGMQFNYLITVKNNGPSSVTNVVLDDDIPNELTITGASGAGWNCTVADPLRCTHPGSLASGQSTAAITVTVTLAASFTGNQVINTAVGTATVEPGKTITAQDDETTPVQPGNVVPPINGIAIIKRVNTFDANAAPGVHVNPGAVLTFTYQVTNTGTTKLTNVKVTDDKIASVSCPATELEAKASMICTAIGSGPAAGQYTNTATATGTPPTGPAVTATDSANVFVVAPAIEIVKSVNGADANSAPGLNIPVGSQVNWTFRVQNTGNVDLKNVTVTDDKVPGVDCGGGSNVIGSLRVGEQKTCSATGVATVGLFTNVGTVVGTPNPVLIPGDPYTPGTISDVDTANYTGTEIPPQVQPIPDLPDDVILPETGGSPAGMVGIAAALLLLGGLLLGLTWVRRRKSLI